MDSLVSNPTRFLLKIKDFLIEFTILGLFFLAIAVGRLGNFAIPNRYSKVQGDWRDGFTRKSVTDNYPLENRRALFCSD